MVLAYFLVSFSGRVGALLECRALLCGLLWHLFYLLVGRCSEETIKAELKHVALQPFRACSVGLSFERIAYGL